jgi:hypothetical protein
MTLESLATVGDNPSVSLPNAADRPIMPGSIERARFCLLFHRGYGRHPTLKAPRSPTRTFSARSCPASTLEPPSHASLFKSAQQ